MRGDQEIVAGARMDLKLAALVCAGHFIQTGITDFSITIEPDPSLADEPSFLIRQDDYSCSGDRRTITPQHSPPGRHCGVTLEIIFGSNTVVPVAMHRLHIGHRQATNKNELIESLLAFASQTLREMHGQSRCPGFV